MKIIKHFITLLAMGHAINAYAVSSGFYLGLMTGPATNSGSEQPVQLLNSADRVLASPRSKQWGTRFFMGYKVNSIAGFEGGISYFSGIHYNTKFNVQTCSGLSVRVRDFDLVGKVSTPFFKWFDVYAKGGVAFIYETVSGALNPGAGPICGKSTYNSFIRPTVSVGASYDLNQSWVVDASWNRIMVGSYAKNVDFYGVSLAYHFVDKYCGQFLC